MESTHKALLHTEVRCLEQMHVIASVVSLNSHCFHGIALVVERLMDVWLFKIGYLTFLKMNAVSLLLQEKQLTVFVTNDEIWTLKQKKKSEFFEDYIYHYELAASQYLKTLGLDWS